MVFSILSLQCTVQKLGIWTEDIQGGLRCRFTKRTACVWSAHWARDPQRLRGGGGRSRHTCPITLSIRRRLLSCVRPSLEIRSCGSVRYRGRKSRRKGNQGLHWHGMKTTSRNQKENTTKQALETTHSSLSLAYLDLFRKIEPTRQRHRLKRTAVRLCSAKTRRAWATNSSVCVFYDFFFS